MLLFCAIFPLNWLICICARAYRSRNLTATVARLEMACLCICKPASHLCAKHHQSTTDWGIAGCRLENQHQRAQRGRQCCLLGPTIMMRINQKLSPSAFLGIATNKQRSEVRKCPLSWGSPTAEESPSAVFFSKEMRLSNVLFENNACFSPHLLTWDQVRAKENRVGQLCLLVCTNSHEDWRTVEHEDSLTRLQGPA